MKIGDRVRILAPIEDEHDAEWTGELGEIVATDFYDAPLYGVLFDDAVLWNKEDQSNAWFMYAEELAVVEEMP